MRALNKAIPRWLDASILKHIGEQAAVDGYTAGLATSFSAKTLSANNFTCTIYTDEWLFKNEPQDTLVKGRLELAIKVNVESSVHACKTALGAFASYLSCIPVLKRGPEAGDDDSVIGRIEVDSDGGVNVNTLGYEEGNQIIILGTVVCTLHGRLEGV